MHEFYVLFSLQQQQRYYIQFANYPGGIFDTEYHPRP